MDREAFMKKVEQFTGLKVVFGYKRLCGEMWFLLSPNGRKVGELQAHENNGAWQFGGCSSIFPDDWMALCGLHEINSPSGA